jgi:hypothetical protein
MVGWSGREGGLADLQGAFELGAGAGQVPQFPEHAPEVAAPAADGGVVGAKGGLADLQGAFVPGAGAGQVPQILEHAAQLVVPPGDVDVVGAERRGGDGERALGERAVGLSQAQLVSIAPTRHSRRRPPEDQRRWRQSSLSPVALRGRTPKQWP